MISIYISAAAGDRSEIKIIKDKTLLGKTNAASGRLRPEGVLLGLERLLRRCNIAREDVGRIVVDAKNGTFSSLRVRVALANALAFAWGIRAENLDGRSFKTSGLKLVKPEYGREANVSSRQ